MAKMKLSDIKTNPNNPRIIKDDKFAKLVKSIKDFPEMLEKRPIVVNSDMVVLGGNMRLKACKEAGLKEVPVMVADWTEEQQRQFIIKDNLGFGEWDWDMIANEWDAEELEGWGLNTVFAGSEWNNMDENELDIDGEFDPMGSASNLHKIVFIFDTEDKAQEWATANITDEIKKFGGAGGKVWQVNLSTTYGK